MERVILFALYCCLGRAALVRCGNSTTFCPSGAVCSKVAYSPTTFGCKKPSGISCKPGPENPPSTSLKNCLVIGDSVSIGYTGVVNKSVPECQVQHGPWDVSDGGAGNTQSGMECLDNWLVTQAQQPVAWDVILFNFGLHNLDNSSSAEATYEAQLLNITQRLQATKAKLMYITTTPFMPLRTQNNTVVEDLNRIALSIMQPRLIPIIDLYKVTTDHCGKLYQDCDWCRRHPCSYHYNNVGESAQGHAVAASLNAALKPSPIIVI